MSWFDLGALAVVALAVFDGARNGLVWALIEAILLLAAAILARVSHGHLEPYLLKIADLEPQDLHCASYLVVFVATGCVFVGALVLVHPASKRWRFRHDRWFGGALGGASGVFASLVIFSIVIWSHPRPSGEESLAESRLVPVLRTAADHGLAGVLPVHVPLRMTELERP